MAMLPNSGDCLLFVFSLQPLLNSDSYPVVYLTSPLRYFTGIANRMPHHRTLLVLFFPLPPIPCPLPILLFLQVSQSGKRHLCPSRSLTLLSSSLHIQLILKTFLSYFNFSASPLTVISSDLQSIFFSPISTCFPSGHSFHSSQSDFV